METIFHNVSKGYLSMKPCFCVSCVWVTIQTAKQLMFWALRPKNELHHSDVIVLELSDHYVIIYILLYMVIIVSVQRVKSSCIGVICVLHLR